MSNEEIKYIKKILCPTCYKIREQQIRKELYENLELGDNLINQCDECRKKGLEVNLDELKEVLAGRSETFGLIDQQSIKDGILWLKEEFPEMYQKLVDLFNQDQKE